MTEYFRQLNEIEYQKLRDAIPLITVLIAGADGTIDNSEISWAEKVIEIRGYKMSEDLIEFYQEVGKDFDSKLSNFINGFSGDINSRTEQISSKLEELNPILAKLDPKVGAHLYKSYVSFAEHVAKSTGGFFGFFSVGAEEKGLMKLNMINPILFAEDSTEEE
ncbi:MAG: hypothetical protein RLZZ546_958 [Bacteroidota bacterium]|jgi:hypothetical protein